MSYETIITINGYEYNITITYRYYPASRGSRDSFGVPLEPDEGALVEIDKIILHEEKNNSYEIKLPHDVLEEIADEILAEYH